MAHVGCQIYSKIEPILFSNMPILERRNSGTISVGSWGTKYMKPLHVL